MLNTSFWTLGHMVVPTNDLPQGLGLEVRLHTISPITVVDTSEERYEFIESGHDL